MFRIFQVVLSIAALSLLVYIILPFLLFNENNVTDYVDKLLGEDYTVSLSSVSWNPVNREFTVEDVQVRRINGDEEERFLEILNLKISKIGLTEAMSGNISANRLQLEGFFVDLDKMPESIGEGDEDESDMVVSINRIELNNGLIHFSTEMGGRGEIHGLTVTGNVDYRADYEDCDLYSVLSEMEIFTDEITYTTGNGYYEITGSGLHINEAHSLFELESVSLDPLKSDEEFLELLEYRTEYFRLSLSGFMVEEFDFDDFRSRQDVVAGVISIDSIDFHVTSDMRLPENPDADVPILPHQALNEIPFRIVFDELRIGHADIRYSEYARDGVRPGSVLFAGTSATVGNLDNRSAGSITVITQSYLMGEGVLDAEFTMQVGQEDFDMNVKGSLGSFDITLLNEVFTDLEGVVIKDGQIHDLVFEYNMSNLDSNGFVDIKYAGLSIDMVSKEDQTQNLRNVLEGFFTDQIVIRSSSSSPGSESRQGKIDEQRDIEKGFFNYLWASLRSGLFDVVKRF